MTLQSAKKMLFNYSQNFILFLKLAWKMFNASHSYGTYHRYVRRIARETIRHSLILNDGSIPERIFKKIRWYMVEAVIMGELLADLTDNPIKEKDRESLIYLGAIMALFDVIVDDFRLDRENINKLLYNTFSQAKLTLTDDITAIEKVYYLYLDKLRGTLEKEHWNIISDHIGMIKMQIKSNEQYSEDISEETVTSITIGKGGVSALICSAFLQQKSDSFSKAVYELGGFIQMMNDCQDIHKDTVAGIKTFVHFSRDFGEVFNRLNEQRIKSFQFIKTLEYSHDGRRRCLFDLNTMFIVIAYKLQRYAETCNYRLDFGAIAEMNSMDFRINPFSPNTVSECFWNILRFTYKNCESTPVFKYKS